MNTNWRFLALTALLLVVRPGLSGPTIISSGYTLPETISPVPAGFGNFGGGYLIDDLGGTSGNSTIYFMPAGGGAPTALANSANLPIEQSFWRGGTFLPSNFGAVGGQFVIATAAGLSTMNASGQVTPFASTGSFTMPVSGTSYTGLATPAIAPSTFGNQGGNLFVTAQTTSNAGVGAVLKVNPNGSFTPFANIAGAAPFGMAFAPSTFGKIGGDMVVSDDLSGNLYAIDAAGNVSLFAKVPFLTGLRQIAFAGSDFGQFSGDLLVSVSGSTFGGGTLGQVLAVDGAGDIVGTLLLGSEVNAFDPRGITLIGNGNFLISDASDPIYIAAASDIRAVPEPATLLSCFVGAGALLGCRRFRRSPSGVSKI